MTDPTAADKLDDLLAAINEYGDPRRANNEWKQVCKILQKSDLPQGRVTGVVGMRDVAGLGTLIRLLREGESEPPPGEVPDADTCRKAYHAFRKRLELTRLDEESSLGHGPLSKGAGHSAAAIVPPSEWPPAVWQELVRQGRLKYIGHGFYELAKNAPHE